MDDGVVRVQVPADPAFVPALVEAASRYADRQGLGDTNRGLVMDIVHHAAHDLAAAGAPVLLLEASADESAISMELPGLPEAVATGDHAAGDAAVLERLGAQCRSFAALPDLTVRFTVARL